MRKKIQRIVLWLVVLMSGKQRLDEQLAYWRHRGVEVPIYGGFNINTSEAGDPRILRVIELYADVPEAVLNLVNNADEADPIALADAVASCGEILVLIHAVAAEDQAVWRGEVLASDAWLDDLMVKLGHPRSVTRLLDAEALVKARAGDLEGACESIVAGLSIGHQIGEHHAMIAVLVEAATVELMIDRFNSIYKRGGMPTQPLIDTIGQIDLPNQFVPTLQWESVYMTRVTTGHVLSPWNMHDMAYSLAQYRRLTELIEIHGIPLHELDFQILRVAHPWWASQYKLVEPGLRSLIWNLTRAQARVELAKAAILLRQHKITHEVYPEALDALVDLAAEPYMDSYIDYQREGDGFVLTSSVGAAGKRLEWHEEE